jgi:hypothetical protein
MRRILTISSLLFAMIACNSERKIAQNDFTNKINRPLSLMKPSDFTFSINNQKADTLLCNTGTKIIIPENCFVDDKGVDIKDSIQIVYNEFNSAADIILSGIPMYVKNGDSVINFQTGGMFTINAFDNGKAVYVKAGKTVSIDMNSNYKGKYDFWQLDTNSKQVWKKLESSSMISVTKSKTANVSEVVKPTEPQKYNKKTDLAFDLGFNLSEFPELKTFSGLMWVYKGDKTRDEVKKIFNKNYDETKLEVFDAQKLEYKLLLKGPGIKEELIVSPVFSGLNYKRAMKAYEKQLSEYNVALKESVIDNQDIKTRRIFSLNSMGTFNCDRFYRYPNANRITAEFKVNDSKLQSEISSARFYHITGDQLNAVVPYYSNNVSFAFNTDEPNVILAVFPDQTVAVFSQKQFLMSGVSSVNSFTFILDVIAKKIKTNDDLKSILATI